MGYHVPEPEDYSSPLPDVVGPTIHLGVCTSSHWNAVLLAACKKRLSLTCHYSIDGQSIWEACASESLDTHGEWKFVRFKLPVVTLKPSAQTVHYKFSSGSSSEIACGAIPVAGAQMEWNVVSYSCYDQRRGVGSKLWQCITGVSLHTCLMMCPVSSAAHTQASWLPAGRSLFL